MTAVRVAVVGAVAVAWAAAAWVVAGTVVPDDLSLPPLDVDAVFGPELVDRAERYERFLYVDWILAQVALLVALGVYARYGARYARESAAGPIGTGMLLGMLGLAIGWLTQLPFGLAALWWDRRHDVSEVGYLEAIFGGWLGLGGTFVAICIALLVVMALARRLGWWWWLPGAAVLTVIAALLVFVGPYLVTGLDRPDPELQATYDRYEREQGVDDIPLRVEEVSGDTSQANAYAFGFGPSARTILWDTLLDGRFSDGEVHFVLAHELAHHSSNHIPEAVAWFGLFAVPGALILTLATRRRGGHGRACSDPARAARDGDRAARAGAGSGRRQPADGERGRLEGAPDDARPTGRPWALPGVRGHVTRRSEPADVGVRDAPEPPDARPARRDGRGLGAPAPRRPALTQPAEASDRSTMTRAMAKADVAPGDGAFRTWSTPCASWKTKSSSSAPSGASAWARIPLGPGRTSSVSSPGKSVRAAATKRLVDTSRAISERPIRQCRRASRRKPPDRAVSRTSRSTTSRRRYPSRASARTAFGPSQTSPSGRVVVWIPRNGNAGSGTG